MKQKTVFSQLCGLSVEERIKFVGSSSLGIRRLDELSILQAAKLDELCPAALSEKVLGAAASCEALNRTSGGSVSSLWAAAHWAFVDWMN